MEIKNGIIEEVRLYIGPHGCLTIDIDINLDCWHCSYGGYCLGMRRDKNTYDGHLRMSEIISDIIDVVEADCWDDIKDKYVRVKIEDGRVVSIGNIIKDKWFCFKKYMSE